MQGTPPHALTAVLVLLGCLGPLACGPSGPVPADAREACEAGRVEEGFVLIKDIGRVDTTAEQDADTVAACLDAAVAAADEDGAWTSLANQLRVVEQLGPTLESPALARAGIDARAAVAYARIVGELCCLKDGLEAFDGLRADPAAEGADTLQRTVEGWYSRARDARIQDGEWVVEVGERMVFATALVDVVPAAGTPAHAERLGQPVTLHNALLKSETRDQPPRVAGSPWTGGAGEAGTVELRTALVRKPGQKDATAIAAEWSDDWDALLADLAPGVLHTCEGRIAAPPAEDGQGTLVLQSCRPEDARTDALFRQRVCTVCGSRDGREVCHVGFGRSDVQAAAQAKEQVCDELLNFDEFAAACGTLIEMSRSCGPNHASADEAPAATTP